MAEGPTCGGADPGVTVGVVAAIPRPSGQMLLVSTVLGLLAAAATVVLLSDGGTDVTAGGPPPTVTLIPAEDAPDFDEARYRTFDGEEVRLASLRGTPTVVNFFASYCTPCIVEMPAIEEVYQRSLASDGEVAFLGLAVADRTDDAMDLVERTGVTYPTGEDRDSSVISALGGTVLPTTVLLDAGGEIVASHAGQLTADQLRDLIADELGVTL